METLSQNLRFHFTKEMLARLVKDLAHSSSDTLFHEFVGIKTRYAKVLREFPCHGGLACTHQAHQDNDGR
jgi:hypothetical protein